MSQRGPQRLCQVVLAALGLFDLALESTILSISRVLPALSSQGSGHIKAPFVGATTPVLPPVKKCANLDLHDERCR